MDKQKLEEYNCVYYIEDENYVLDFKGFTDIGKEGKYFRKDQLQERINWCNNELEKYRMIGFSINDCKNIIKKSFEEILKE